MSIDDDTAADRQYLIWSNHHKAWWGPNGSNYFKDVARAGRYAVSDTARWLGRGCGCCKVPEVVIPAVKVNGRNPQSARGVVTAATRAAVKAGQTNSYYGK